MQMIQEGTVDGPTAKLFLEREGILLSAQREDHYYYVWDRFNQIGNLLDFLFLNRSCFNDFMRFNRHGKFNVPFGHKPRRFAPAYVTKIVNQVVAFQTAVRCCHWIFMNAGITG